MASVAPRPEAPIAANDNFEEAVLERLAKATYEETAEAFGISRGKVYQIALKNGARKTERRIMERAAERKARQAETLQAMIDATSTADVLDYFEALPNECAQLILTSCPYNVGKCYGDGVSADAMRHVYFAGWLSMVVSEISRVLAPGGVAFFQCGSTRDEIDGSMVPIDIMMFDVFRKTGLDYQNRVSWVIPHGLTPKRRLSERHESALIFSKGPPASFNPDPARTPQKNPGKRAFKGPNKGKLSGHPYGAWPSDVWAIGNVGANHPEKTGHPAQFPEELAMRAVQLYTKPGDLVIDPFSGSGTTHVVARRTGRQFSGCDLFYEDMRAARLADAELDNVCTLPGISEQSRAIWQAEAIVRGTAPGEIRQKSLFE